MTKAELIRALEPFDDDIEIRLYDTHLGWEPIRNLYYNMNNGEGSIIISCPKLSKYTQYNGTNTVLIGQ